MLTTPFKDYNEFKELFVGTKANGEIRRKNGVLLSFIKSKDVRKFLSEKTGYSVAQINNMAMLYDVCNDLLSVYSRKWSTLASRYYVVTVGGKTYYSDKYRTDGRNGVRVDGDLSYFRYQNMERNGRVFKMKIGKMFRHLIDLTELRDVFPESVKLWFCEEKTREWEAFSASQIPSNLFLHVDDDFCSIYAGAGKRARECDGSFGSCMQGNTHFNWMFYRDAVKAKAAYLTEGNEPESLIVARCVVYTEVTRHDTDEIIRVAERQYSRGGDEMLQRILIQKLKDGGYIDAYKKTGAGCGDAQSFVDINGNSLSDVMLSIECNLEDDDYMSYQDSFKWYDYHGKRAYNGSCDEADEMNLSSTESIYSYEGEDNHDNEVYSEYESEWIGQDDATWVETRGDYFYDQDTVYGHIYANGRWYEESLHEDDAIYIDGEYYYAGEDCESPEEYGLTRCPYCNKYFIDENGCYSEITGEYYCCNSCMEEAENEYKRDCWYYSELTEEYYETESELEDAENEYKEEHGWVYSEYDEEWFEDEDDIAEIITGIASDLTVTRITISRETLEELIENGEAVMVPDGDFAYKTEVLEKLAA